MLFSMVMTCTLSVVMVLTMTASVSGFLTHFVPTSHHATLALFRGCVLKHSSSSSVRMAAAAADGGSKLGNGGVVITGAASGVGFAMAEQLAQRGIDTVLADIQSEVVEAAAKDLCTRYGNRALAVQCDVSNAEDIDRLGDEAQAFLGHINVWMNNAGINGGRVPLRKLPAEKVAAVVNTNLVGVLLGTRKAMDVMVRQTVPTTSPSGLTAGHIFNTVGSGCRGEATPGYASYGATKRGLVQLLETLKKEIEEDKEMKDKVGVHNISPGMVFTRLLLDDSTPELRSFFDVLASEPREVAEDLVPKVLAVAVEPPCSGKFLQYLTPDKIALRLLNGLVLGQSRGYYDKQGNKITEASS